MSKTPYQLFGKEVGKGWLKIVNPLIKMCETEGVKIFQIKEKFGGLRFYVGTAPEHIYEAITKAEHEAEVTCEDCGEPGTLRRNGWMRTLCDKHAKEHGYK